MQNFRSDCCDLCDGFGECAGLRGAIAAFLGVNGLCWGESFWLNCYNGYKDTA
ncbi:hypothetical protein [Spirulina major]|uniref:hypothetical protein n=1 Tax=Spirulina major TaxID=270636 RepID=UPI001587E802|nr:hypothetical protein [Spirulina major]